jgi:hypothetical protein
MDSVKEINLGLLWQKAKIKNGGKEGRSTEGQ